MIETDKGESHVKFGIPTSRPLRGPGWARMRRPSRVLRLHSKRAPLPARASEQYTVGKDLEQIRIYITNHKFSKDCSSAA